MNERAPLNPFDPTTMSARLSVWTTLSELFLDTELDEADFRRIAEVLRGSPYDLAMLENILRDEVAPAFGSNLLSVAGQWAPWTEDEVQEIMKRSLSRTASGGWVGRIRACFQRQIVPDEWSRIVRLLE